MYIHLSCDNIIVYEVVIQSVYTNAITQNRMNYNRNPLAADPVFYHFGIRNQKHDQTFHSLIRYSRRFYDEFMMICIQLHYYYYCTEYNCVSIDIAFMRHHMIYCVHAIEQARLMYLVFVCDIQTDRRTIRFR